MAGARSLSGSLPMGKNPRGLPTYRKKRLPGWLYHREGVHGGGSGRHGGLERVDPFALFLWHIGPPVIVTAEHVRLHMVGYALSGATPGRRERLQSLYHERSRSLGTDRRRPERFVA